MKRHLHYRRVGAARLGLIFTIFAIVIGLAILAREWRRAHPNHSATKTEHRHHGKHATTSE